jgi:hypothetical protein
MQIELHSIPMIVETSHATHGPRLLKHAKRMTWSECPKCSENMMDTRIKKLQQTTSAGTRWLEMIDGEVCFIEKIGRTVVKMIEGREMDKGTFKRRYQQQRFGEFTGSYSYERMMTKEQRDRLWEDGEVVRETDKRRITKADRKKIGPFMQNNANLKLSHDKVVCGLHPETVFAVRGSLAKATARTINTATYRRELHNVCGHYRILASGERTWVRTHNRGGF